MNKKEHKIVNDLKDNSQHRAWLFLAVYFIFFAFIIISLRSNNDAIRKKINNVYRISYFNAERLKNNNYHFIYSVNIDNNEVIYEGDKMDTKEVFTKNKAGVIEKYYNDNNIFSKLVESSWVNTENPYEIITFRDIDSFKKIIDKATYVSRTENADKSNIYSYKISTSTLLYILDSTTADLDDIPNQIKVYTNTNNEVIKVEYDFSSYFNYKKVSLNSLVITMNYSNYGEIDNIVKE